jgi:hypothetical protein
MSWIRPSSIFRTASKCTGNHRHVQAAPSRLRCGLSPPHRLLSFSLHYFALLSRWLICAQGVATQQHPVRAHFILAPIPSRCLTRLRAAVHVQTSNAPPWPPFKRTNRLPTTTAHPTRCTVKCHCTISKGDRSNLLHKAPPQNPAVSIVQSTIPCFLE